MDKSRIAETTGTDIKTSEKENNPVRPAFSSNKQAIAFLILIIFLLILPILITQSGKISRSDSYELMPESWGPYTFVENEIFDNNQDIDILFIGSSLAWAGIDAPQIQKELSNKLGRPARVVTFGHSFNSLDIPYMEIKDLLESKRHVGLVVLSIPRNFYPDSPSVTAYKFIRYSDDKGIFEELPLKYKFSLYAASILRAPSDFLMMLRQNRSEPSIYSKDLGALKNEAGWQKGPFEVFNPTAVSADSKDLIYSPENQGRFEFINDEVPTYQRIYLSELVKLLRKENIPLAMINVPQYSERHSDKVIEKMNWSQSLDTDIPLIGIPPAVLYAGLSEEEIKKLHYNEHINKNGNEFFTHAVMPGILDVYEKYVPKK